MPRIWRLHCLLLVFKVLGFSTTSSAQCRIQQTSHKTAFDYLRPCIRFRASKSWPAFNNPPVRPIMPNVAPDHGFVLHAVVMFAPLVVFAMSAAILALSNSSTLLWRNQWENRHAKRPADGRRTKNKKSGTRPSCISNNYGWCDWSSSAVEEESALILSAFVILKKS